MPTQLTINEQALIPAIAQDAQTGAVLMVAHMNHEALTRTIETVRRGSTVAPDRSSGTRARHPAAP